MGEPAVKILDAYRQPFSTGLFEEAMQLKYGGLELTPEERSEAEKSVREELSNIILFEVLVSNADNRFYAGDFSQRDQVAYDEAYLSENGEAIISRDLEKVTGRDFRIAFFVHFIDPDLPLATSYGTVDIPPLKDMPERLLRLMPYDPVT